MTWVRRAAPSLTVVRELRGGYENDVALVVDADSGARFVVRRSMRRTVDEVESEMAFIAAAHRAGVGVAPGLPAFNGRSVIGGPTEVFAAFMFVNGETRSGRTHHEITGLIRLVAALGVAGRSVGADPRRPTRGFYDRIHRDIGRGSAHLLSASDRRCLHSAVDDMYLDGAANADGLVHGDIHPLNVLWCGERPTIIDFDDSYRGTYRDEVFAFARGYGFDGATPHIPTLRRVLRSLLGDASPVPVRLAAECAYFYAALLDSAERAGVAVTDEYAIDLHRACLVARLPPDALTMPATEDAESIGPVGNLEAR